MSITFAPDIFLWGDERLLERTPKLNLVSRTDMLIQ